MRALFYAAALIEKDLFEAPRAFSRLALKEIAMRFARSLLLGTPLWVLLCFPPIVTANEASDRASLEAAAQAWIKAFNARDLDALTARTTTDIVLMDAATSSAVSGRAAARDLWTRALPAAGQVTSTTKEAVITGDVAWRIGALASKQPNGTVASRGQSLEIWKRSNGEWKLHRQMSSHLLAASAVSPALPSQPVYDKPAN